MLLPNGMPKTGMRLMQMNRILYLKYTLMVLKIGKGPWWSALVPPGVLRKCQEMPTVSKALPPSRLSHVLVITLVMQFTAAERQRQKAGIRCLSNNGILWLREGHPDRKPRPSWLGVGHGANPPIP